MKVTFRVALMGLLAAATMAQTASATSFSVVRQGTYYTPETASAGVVPGTTRGADVSATFAQIRPTLEAAVEPDVCCQTWEDVTVCSPAVGDDPIHRYADPSFWTIAGSPVQNLDFILPDRTEQHRRNEISALALDSTSMAEQCVARTEYTYIDGRFCMADGAGSNLDLAPADCGTGL